MDRVRDQDRRGVPTNALHEMSQSIETTACLSVSAMPVHSDMIGTLIKIGPHAYVPLTFRLRSVYVPSTIIKAPIDEGSPQDNVSSSDYGMSRTA